MDQAMVRRLGAEFLGTFILVLGGCGSAVLAAKLFAPSVTSTPARRRPCSLPASDW